MIPSNGADITFDPKKVGKYEELLTWKKLKVASLFCGCGGTDVGMMGGFDFWENIMQKMM